MFVVRRPMATALLAATVYLMPINASFSETLLGAMAKAYNNNPELNSARADLRIRDEDVAIAKSGYRPNVTWEVEGSYSSNIKPGEFRSQQNSNLQSSLSVRQNLFDGFRTKNSIKQAQSGVYFSREALRDVEQQVLLEAVTAYLSVIRDSKISALRKKNVAFLVEQVRSAKARFEVGEGTRTDVAQANAGRSAAIAQLNAAEAQYKASAATYRQVIGDDPKDLKAATSAIQFLPKSLTAALEAGASDHPVIAARKHGVDAAAFGVKVAEGSLLPTLGVEGGIRRTGAQQNKFSGPNGETTTDASIGMKLTVPIYQAGRVSAQVRQKKEELGQARITVDVATDSIRTAITSSWGQYEALKASVVANKQVVAAAQLALDGVIEERKVGQRTTLDVLNAQSDVVDAQLNLVASEHDVVRASYAILQATGRLSADKIGLAVALYKPEEHYDAVKDKWFGLRTPDQR